jgi:PAS domain S-box-containing protein
MDERPHPKTLFLKVTHEAPREDTQASELPGAPKPAGPSPTVRHLQTQIDGTLYQEVLHGMYDGVLIVDMKGRLLDANTKACKMCRASKADLCRLGVTEVLDSVDAAMMQSVVEALGTGQHVVVETDCRRLDGTMFPCDAAVMRLDVSGEEHLCFFVHDVSEHRQTEEELNAAREELMRRNLELQASEETLRTSLEQVQAGERELARERDLLQALMDNTPDRIFIKNKECRFLKISRALAEFYGLNDPGVAVGQNDFDFFEEETAKEFFDDDMNVLRTGEPLVDKVQRFDRADGATQWSSVTKAPIRDAHGAIIGLVGISRDITERMLAEEQLKAAQKQLEKAERLEATALFAGQIAHDFNNLLVPLLIYPDIIRKSLDPEGQAFKDLETMQNMAQQIADINQDLMALARRGKIRQELVDTNSVIMDVAEFFRRSRPQGDVRVDCYPLAGSPAILFDPPQLTRVLQNLVQNAVDALGEQGHVALRTENVELNGPIGANARVIPGEYVRVSVSDNGCGIPEEIREKIFDPFFTTKDGTMKRRRGTGLGLSVVYGIVTDHAGYVDFESQVGKGTTFHIYFPAAKGQVEKPEKVEIRGGDEWILIVEDDPLQTRVVSRVFTELGYRVATAAGGEEALGLIRQCAGDGGGKFPDLAVLDLVLGDGMDGAETYRQLKRVHSALKAVTISGFRESDKVAAAQALGAGKHLIKPVTLQALADAVRRELDRKA